MANQDRRGSYRARSYASYISRRGWEPTSFQEAAYRSWSRAARVRFAGWLPADHTAPILDLGCGHGNFLYLVEQSGYSDLTGVDVGAEQLAQAARIAPGAILVKDDILGYLSACSQQFELIVCLNVVEHFHKSEFLEFLDLLTTALRSGGRVIFETPNAESPWFGAVAYSDLTHEWFFTPRGLGDALRLVGLVDFEARPAEPIARIGRALVRYLLWQGIRQLLAVWNIAETGSVGSGIYTRVFAASAQKPAS